MEKLTQL
jgi:Leucine-rich repeat (LRR) protein